MNTEIKNRFTNGIIVEAGKYASLKKAVEQNKADLWGADLRRADLRGADLGGADLWGANLGGANLRRANLRRANLREANLGGANLRRANLRDADLRGADLDFSCFPLWCGAFDVKIDNRLIWQLICHITRLDISECSKEAKEAVVSLKKWENEFCKFRDDVKPI